MADSSSSAKFAPVTFSHPLTTKLNNTNFIIWRKQVMATIRGHCLQSFIFGASPPLKFLTDQDKQACNVNQDYLDWEQQDSLIVSWLFSSMTESVLTRLVNCESSHQIWKTLETYFASQVRAKISQFQTQLKTVKKDSLSMNDYLLKIRNLVDLLALVDNKLTDREHINAIFEGLSSDYETFILSIETRKEAYSVDEIESLLLAQETRIEKRTDGQLSMDLSMANFTQVPGTTCPHGSASTGSSGSNGFSGNSQGRGNFQGRGPNRGGFNGRGRGRGGRFGRGGGNGKPQCQVCGKFGHIALKCYYRFNHDFLGPSQLQGQSQSHSQMPLQGHFTKLQPGYFDGSQFTVNPGVNYSSMAMVATPETSLDSCWYPDSGATNHVTSNAENLMHKAPFSGSEQVHIGNGKGLKISHIGHLDFPSPFLNTRHFS